MANFSHEVKWWLSQHIHKLCWCCNFTTTAAMSTETHLQQELPLNNKHVREKFRAMLPCTEIGLHLKTNLEGRSSHQLNWCYFINTNATQCRVPFFTVQSTKSKTILRLKDKNVQDNNELAKLTQLCFAMKIAS